MNTKISADLYIDLLKQSLTASLYDESAWRPARRHGVPLALLRDPKKFIWRVMQNLVVSVFEKFNLILVRNRPYVADVREGGLDWPCFGFTMVGLRGLDNIQQCVEKILDENVPGDFVETGVWRGGSCIFMRALLSQHSISDRAVWCCDSFEGMPVIGNKDKSFDSTNELNSHDYLSVTLEQVQANFRRFGLLDDRVKFLKGWFSDTLPTAPIDRISLLILDGDYYESTKDALTYLYPKMSPGGVVIIDEYQGWIGCRTAVDEYREQHGIHADLQKIHMNAVYWRVPEPFK